MCENKRVAYCDVIPINRFAVLAWIIMVQVILIKRFLRLLKVCDIDGEIGLEHAKNIRNLFLEKFDARKVGNIN